MSESHFVNDFCGVSEMRERGTKRHEEWRSLGIQVDDASVAADILADLHAHEADRLIRAKKQLALSATAQRTMSPLSASKCMSYRMIQRACAPIVPVRDSL